MSALVNVFQSAQLWLYRHSRQYKHRDSMDLHSQIQNTSKVLVCMPVNEENVHPAKDLVVSLSQFYPKWQITLTYDERTSMHALAEKFQCYTFKEEDLSFFGKPKKQLMRTLTALKPDVAFDLNHDFNFTTLSLVWNSRAAIRVGFYHEIRKDFYNFLFRKKPETTVERSYHMLYNYFKAL